MEYHISPVTGEERIPEIRALFAEGLGETTLAFWHWKHFMPNGMPDSLLIQAEDTQGKLVGMYAIQPLVYSNSQTELIMIQDQDLVITPSARGSGLMKNLREYMNTYCKSIYGRGIMSYSNENSYPIFMKYGAEDMGDIYGLTSSKALLPIYKTKAEYTYREWTIESTKEMPSDIFFTVPDTTFKMKKTPEFMRWKFDQNPDEDFQWLLIRKNGELMGYFVFQICQGRFRRAVNIYDWDIKSHMPTDILKKAVSALKSLGNWVSLWGRYDSEITAMWEKAGLRQTTEKGTHFLLTSLTGENLPRDWQLTRADLDF